MMMFVRCGYLYDVMANYGIVKSRNIYH